MRIGRVMMGVMVVVMSVVMVMMVAMIVHDRASGVKGRPCFAAEILVAAGGVAIAIAGAVLQPAANALDMVVMAFLRRADLGLEAEHRLAVFAQGAVHQVLAERHLAQRGR